MAGLLVGLPGCTSVGNVGIISKSSADPGAFLRNSRVYKDLGPAEARVCRFFIIGLVPAGNADIQAATDKALKKSGADALVNVATSNSLYGFFPLYNVLSVTCTTVKGSAVKFE